MRIEQFITDRLAEDERLAQEADSGDGEWFFDDRFDRVETSDENVYTLHHVEHMARHNPARVLRDIQAWRAMMRAVLEYEGELDHLTESAPPDQRSTLDHLPALRAIAAIWSDHPDYQAEWAQ